MQAIKTILKILAGLVLVFMLLLGIGVIVLKSIDWNNHKDSLANLVEKHSDFQVTKLDHLDLHIGWQPALTLEGFALERQNNSVALKSFSAEKFSSEIKLLPMIFQKQIHIENFELNQANMVMTADVEEKDPEVYDEDEELGERWKPFLKQARIEDSSFTFETAEEPEEPLKLVVDSLVAKSDEAEDPVQLDGRGQFAEIPWQLKGQLAPLNVLQDSSKPYPVQVSLSALDNQVQLSAVIYGLAEEKQNAQIDIQGEGKDLHQILNAFQLNVDQLPPYTFELNVSASADALAAQDISLTFGETYIYGDVTMEVNRPRPLIKADLGSSLINLNDVMRLLPTDDEAPEEELDEEAVAEGPIFTEDPIPTDFLTLVDADVSLAIAEIKGGFPGFLLQNLKFDAKLEDGKLSIDPLELATVNGSAGGNLSVERQKEALLTQFQIGMRNIELSLLISPFIKQLELIDLQPQEALTGELIADIDVKTHGKSMRQLASNFGGTMNFVVEQGSVASTFIQALGIDVPKTLASWLADHPSTRLECMIAMFSAKEGQIDTEHFLISTSSVNVLGDGVISLAEENLSFRIETRAKDFSIGSTQSPIELEGPFRDIKVRIITDELLTRIGAAIAGALVNPALSLAPFVDLGLAEEGKCGEFVKTMQNIEVDAEEKVSH
ncbi:MAG: AsmA family protein [Oligoflexus sp.]